MFLWRHLIPVLNDIPVSSALFIIAVGVLPLRTTSAAPLRDTSWTSPHIPTCEARSAPGILSTCPSRSCRCRGRPRLSSAISSSPLSRTAVRTGLPSRYRSIQFIPFVRDGPPAPMASSLRKGAGSGLPENIRARGITEVLIWTFSDTRIGGPTGGEGSVGSSPPPLPVAGNGWTCMAGSGAGYHCLWRSPDPMVGPPCRDSPFRGWGILLPAKGLEDRGICRRC